MMMACVFLLTERYDEYPKRMSDEEKYRCFGECYVPTKLVRKVDPSIHNTIDVEAAARGDSFTSRTFHPFEPKNPTFHESKMAAMTNVMGAMHYKMDEMIAGIRASALSKQTNNNG